MGFLWEVKVLRTFRFRQFGGILRTRTIRTLAYTPIGNGARRQSAISDLYGSSYNGSRGVPLGYTYTFDVCRNFANLVNDDDAGKLLDESDLTSDEENEMYEDEDDDVETGEEPTIEEQYSRKTPLEHILLRPGMYVGPTTRLPPASVWVLDPLPPPPPLELVQEPHRRPVALVDANLDSTAGEDGRPSFRMVKRDYGLVPALIKVFDEVLVNATDNRLRHPKSCTRIDVVIDPGNASEGRGPLIRVWNNGKGIPIHLHATEQLYIPEMVFGHLLTGSNFDDTKKTSNGRYSRLWRQANQYILSANHCRDGRLQAGPPLHANMVAQYDGGRRAHHYEAGQKREKWRLHVRRV
jgi:hypothetical protein